MPSHWGLGFIIGVLERYKHLVHSTRHSRFLHTLYSLTGIISSIQDFSPELWNPKHVLFLFDMTFQKYTEHTHTHTYTHINLTISRQVLSSSYSWTPWWQRRALFLFLCLKMPNNMLNKWTVSTNNSVLMCSSVWYKRVCYVSMFSLWMFMVLCTYGLCISSMFIKHQ